MNITGNLKSLGHKLSKTALSVENELKYCHDFSKIVCREKEQTSIEA